MKAPATKIEHALLDVRKAYRLLHDYQRMVMDAANYIGKQTSLEWYGGWPKYSDATRQGERVKMNHSAWDWLNMMMFEFHFLRPIDKEKYLRLSILLISDTGFFCAEDETLQKANTHGYIPAERAATKLGFIISGEHWPDTSFMGNKATMKKFIEENGELPEEWKRLGIIAICVDLSRIASEEETNSLLDEIVAFANKAGIPLNRISH